MSNTPNRKRREQEFQKLLKDLSATKETVLLVAARRGLWAKWPEWLRPAARPAPLRRVWLGRECIVIGG